MANNYRKNRRRKTARTVMQSLTIKEMSGVDVPAQEGAKAVILKRADTLPEGVEGFLSCVKAGDFTGICQTMSGAEGFATAAQAVTTTATRIDGEYQVSDGLSFKFVKSPEEELIEKLVMLTSEEDGHQHAVRLERWTIEDMGGSTSYQGGDQLEHHSHDFTIGPDGSITIGASNGHTHEVDMTVIQQLQTVFSEKSAKPGDPDYEEDDDKKSSNKKPAKSSGKSSTSMEKSDMDEEEVQALIAKALEESNASHAAELAKAQAIGSLTDVQKSFYNDLPEGEQADYLKLAPEARQAAVDSAISKRESANPVVHTSVDGTEYRKSDDPRLVEMAKRDDKREAELNVLRSSSETASLTKRAEELSSLPGTVDSKVAMLKAIDGIPNAEQREASLTALKAQNTEMAQAFETRGVRPGDAVITKSSEQELSTLVQKYASEHGVDEANAYSKVLETAEGARLYEQSVTQ